MKGIMIHVGADSKRPGFVGPIFLPERKFEFIPINAGNIDTSLMYADIDAENFGSGYGTRLADFLPTHLATTKVHFDPDFCRYRYGEPKGSKKGSALLKLEVGDIIFFYASLAPYDREVYDRKAIDLKLRSYQQGKKDKYVIGFFTLKERAKANGSVEVFGDQSRSSRLTYAVPLTDGQTRQFFRLNHLSREIWSKDPSALRNFHKIDEKQIRLVTTEILRWNPDLKDKLKHLLDYQVPSTN